MLAKQLKMMQRKQGGFLSMLSGILDVSSLRNLLIGKGTIRAGSRHN